MEIEIANNHFEQYRESFELDFNVNHSSNLLNILRREGEGYYHMEADRAWEYFKKGIKEKELTDGFTKVQCLPDGSIFLDNFQPPSSLALSPN